MVKKVMMVILLVISLSIMPEMASATEGIEFCKDPGFLTVYRMIMILIDIVKILIPILIIIFGVIEFGRAMVATDAGEVKKATKSLILKIVAGIVIFLLPAVINAVMGVIAEYSTVASDIQECDKNANKDTINRLREEQKNNSTSTDNPNDLGANTSTNSGVGGGPQLIRSTAPTSNDANWTASKNIFAAAGFVSQCTWYAHGRAKEILDFALENGQISRDQYNVKIEKLNSMRGNAGLWYTQNINAGSYTFPYGSVPKPGSLLITGNNDPNSPYGHVEVVERVIESSDAVNLHITEGWSSGGNGWGSIVFKDTHKSQAAAERRGHDTRYFIGYIYLLD